MSKTKKIFILFDNLELCRNSLNLICTCFLLSPTQKQIRFRVYVCVSFCTRDRSLPFWGVLVFLNFCKIWVSGRFCWICVRNSQFLWLDIKNVQLSGKRAHPRSQQSVASLLEIAVSAKWLSTVSTCVAFRVQIANESSRFQSNFNTE